MVNIIKALAGVKLMTYRFVEIALTHYTMSLGNNYGEEKIMNLYWILLFISKGSMSQYGGVP